MKTQQALIIAESFHADVLLIVSQLQEAIKIHGAALPRTKEITDSLANLFDGVNEFRKTINDEISGGIIASLKHADEEFDSESEAKSQWKELMSNLKQEESHV